MKSSPTISKKITFGFACVVSLTIACGIAGLYAAQRHKKTTEQLEFIVNKAWTTADGAMEATIFIEAEMIAVQNVLNNNEIPENKHRIKIAIEKSTDALSRIQKSGIIDSSTLSELDSILAQYKKAQEQLLKTHQILIEKNKEYRAQSSAIVEFSGIMEEIGDGAVEELEQSPDQQTSWNSGLKNRWQAADGGMESFIGFLEQQFHTEQLIQGGNIEITKAKITEALAFQEGAMEEMFSTKLFDVPAPNHGNATFVQVYRKNHANYTSQLWSMVETVERMNSARSEYILQAQALLDKLEVLEEDADQAIESFEADFSQISSLILGITGASVLIAGVIGTLTYRSIIAPLKAMSDSLSEVSEQSIATASEVSHASKDLAETSSSQAASLEETRSSMEQIATMTKNCSESAANATALSSETRLAAERGASEMDSMRSAMNQIKNSSCEISNIIKTIDEIAFQTNILALNAAVEAARAGEAGSGFAIVADEVRALAMRSAKAARETAALIDQAVVKSQNGVDISENMASTLGGIVDKARSLDQLVEEISQSTLEQTNGIQQISTAIAALW